MVGDAEVRQQASVVGACGAGCQEGGSPRAADASAACQTQARQVRTNPLR